MQFGKRSYSQVLGVAAFLIVLVWGIGKFHAAILYAESPMTHGDLGDARLINLYLDHVYAVVVGGWPTSINSTPWAFYPFPNVLYFTDSLLGGQVTYLPLRLMGFDSFAAYQWWQILNSVLNFLCMGWYLRAGARAHWLGVIAGAYLFAFSMPRNIALNHPQLHAHFWTPLAVLFFVNYVRARGLRRRTTYLWLAAMSVAMQVWASFYLGWYLVFGSTLALLYWLCSREPRRQLFARIREDRIAYALAALSALIFLLPFIVGHMRVKGLIGTREWSEINDSLPQITSYFYTHKDSWLYGRNMHWVSTYLKPMQAAREWSMFPGFLATFAPLVFFILRCRQRSNAVLQQPIAGTVLVVFSLIFLLSFTTRTGHTLWWIVFQAFPGASAIRAMVRVAMFQSFLVGTMLAIMITWLMSCNRVGVVLGAALMIGVIAESQMTNDYAFSAAQSRQRVDAVITRLQDRSVPCRSFYLADKNEHSPVVNIDAMLASMQTKIPTMNGYVGNVPPGYDLDPRITAERDVAEWLRRSGVGYDPLRDCVISN